MSEDRPDYPQQPDAPACAAVFHFDADRPSFDDLSLPNGERRWSSVQLMELLGYATFESFRGVINKAVTTCMTVNAPVMDHFKQVGPDQYMLTKFACYLVAMNGDSKKPAVAWAQAYFATITEAFQKYIESAEDVERVEIRSDLSEHMNSLNSTAKAHGVESYPFFHDQGYLGLYNMRLKDLREHKGLPSSRTPLDFMGKRELAANLFRIAETEARIEQRDLRGQAALENAAYTVGASVRQTMLANTGVPPEALEVSPDIKKVESDLRRTLKGLKAAASGERKAIQPPPEP